MHLVRRPSDFLSGLVFFVVGAFAISVARNYELGTLRTMGPAYYPIIVAALLSAVGLLLVGRSFRGEREERIEIALVPLLFVLGGILAFALLLMQAGLPLAVMALVLIAAGASGRYRKLTTLLLAAGLAIGCVALFVIGLGQRLPILGSWFPALHR